MRRAAYTNDISKPPIVLRVLGSIVKWTLIALLAGLVAAAAYFVVRGYALYNNAAQEKSVADMVTDIESRAGFTPLEEAPRDIPGGSRIRRRPPFLPTPRIRRARYRPCAVQRLAGRSDRRRRLDHHAAAGEKRVLLPGASRGAKDRGGVHGI